MLNKHFNALSLRLTNRYRRLRAQLDFQLRDWSYTLEHLLVSGCDRLSLSLRRTDAILTIYVQDVERYDRFISI